MNSRRRLVMKWLLASATLAAIPLRALATMVRPEKAFSATSPGAAFEAIGDMQDSDSVMLESPDIAENGAVVPVAVSTELPGAEKIYILIEKNPNPLAAMFLIPEGSQPFVQTRVKMAQTSMVYAVVEAQGKLYRTGRETKVTLGGCGG